MSKYERRVWMIAVGATCLLLVCTAVGSRAEPVVTCDAVRSIVRANPDKSLDQLALLYHLNSSELDLAMSCLSHPGPKPVKTEKVHAPRATAGVRADPYDTDGRRRVATPVARPLPRAPGVGDVGVSGPPGPNVPGTVRSPDPAVDVAPDVQHHDEPPAVVQPQVNLEPAVEQHRKMEGWRAMSMEILLVILAAIMGWEGSKLGFKGIRALAAKWAARAKTVAPLDALKQIADLQARVSALDGEFHARLVKLETPATPQPATAAPTGPASPVS